MNEFRDFNEIFWKDVTLTILKVTKKQGFTLTLEDKFLDNPQRGDRRGIQIDPSAVLELNSVEKLPTNCLSVFDHFVKLALKGLKAKLF